MSAVAREDHKRHLPVTSATQQTSGTGFSQTLLYNITQDIIKNKKPSAFFTIANLVASMFVS